MTGLDAKAPLRSANFNTRKLPISMLVLHYTGMENAEIALARLCDPAAGVSAHYVLGESGEIFNLVPEEKRAWHAGVSSWHGITDVNSASIGVEIVNGGHDFGLPGFPQVQINALIGLCQGILSRHSISPNNIVGHNEVAPDRKLDPGEKFPWQELALAGIGNWPQEPVSLPADLAAPNAAQAKKWLAGIGYDVEMAPLFGKVKNSIISEFQRRYSPNNITGELCQATYSRIFQIANLAST